MRRLSSLRSCVGLAMTTPRQIGQVRACRLAATKSSLADHGETSLSAQYRGDRPLLTDREYNDRHTGFPSKGKGCGVHNLEAARNRLLVGQALVTMRIAVLLRVGAVDAVDVSGLEHGIGADLGGAQNRGRVGCKERIAGSGSKDED